jgi:hypothetical protein
VFGNYLVDWRDATFIGGTVATNLRFMTDNGQYRMHLLPSSGVRLDVGSITTQEARVYVNPTNVTEDYFATVRSHGGKIAVNGVGSLGNKLYLQNGTFRSSDFVSLNNGPLVFDTDNTGRNVRFSGTFAISNGGPSFVYWTHPSAATPGQLYGDIEVGTRGTLALGCKDNYAAVLTVNGNVRLKGGSLLWRNVGRTVRLKVSTGNALYLGDGNPSTRETNTFRGILIDSGGPNEAWGCDADTVVDDGNAVLRYEGPHAPASSALYKYAVNWRNSSGTVLPFRGGAGGTIFAPSNTLINNGGMVIHGSTPTVFTATSRAALATPGLMTFSTTLPNHGVQPTPGNVIVTGSGASFDLLAAGTVRVARVTVTNGAALSGIGRIEGAVSACSSVLRPGNSAGTLTVTGSVAMATNTVLSVELGTPGAIGGGTNDLLVVGGNLTLDGIVNVGALSGFGVGTYVLIAYGGAVTDNGLIVGSMPGGLVGRVTVDTGNKQVKLEAVRPQGTIALVR